MIRTAGVFLSNLIGLSLCVPGSWSAEEPSGGMVSRPGLFQPLTEPPCSYCSTQNRKGFVKPDDPVLAWIRGAHNGGAIPLRHFLAAPRVINDTYGLFFYDPDGGYVSAFTKDYGYAFEGWRRGVMVVKSKDGTLWSALTGRAIEGPQAGKRLTRIPSLTTQWGHWLMLHPESTAYDLFDGTRYPPAELPSHMSREARQTMPATDPRLQPGTIVLGIELTDKGKAFPIDETEERACWNDTIEGREIVVMWYGLTRTAVAFGRKLHGRSLTFYADGVSPESAPFKDKETGTRWTLAGRAVDGALRGAELEWVPGIQCLWHAWASEYPETDVHQPSER